MVADLGCLGCAFKSGKYHANCAHDFLNSLIRSPWPRWNMYWASLGDVIVGFEVTRRFAPSENLGILLTLRMTGKSGSVFQLGTL